MDDFFGESLAKWPGSGTTIPNAEAQVYAITDTTFSTPLPITTLEGVPLAKLVASQEGIFGAFKVPGHTEVNVRSKNFTTRLASRLGPAFAVESNVMQAASEAETSRVAAETARDDAIEAAAQATAPTEDAVAVYLAAEDSEPRQVMNQVIDDRSTGWATIQPTLARLKRGQEDVTILFISDSTATESWEWVRLVTGMLAEDWPNYTTHYYLWDYTSQDWPATPEVVSAGAGTRFLRVYNLSYGGWSTSDARSHYAKGVAGLSPNLIIVSHGHNEAYGSVNQVPGTEMRIALTNFMEQLAATHPLADLVMVAENPDRNKIQNDSHRASIIAEICRAAGYGFIDACQRFLDAGVPAEWYMDSTHPNAVGMLEWADVVAGHLKYRPMAGQVTRQESAYLVPRPNLVADGKFESYTSGLPAGWAKSPSATTVTVTKDTSRFDSARGYSLKVVSSPNDGQVYYTLPTALYQSLIGEWVTFAARVFTPAAATGPSGRVSASVSVSGQSITPVNYGGQVRDQWRWQTVSLRVPAGSAYVRLAVYTGSEVNIDRVVLVRGLRPHDAI